MLVLIVMEPSSRALADKFRDLIESYPIEIRGALWRFYVEGGSGDTLSWPDGFEHVRRSLRAFANAEAQRSRNGNSRQPRAD